MENKNINEKPKCFSNQDCLKLPCRNEIGKIIFGCIFEEQCYQYTMKKIIEEFE